MPTHVLHSHTKSFLALTARGEEGMASTGRLVACAAIPAPMAPLPGRNCASPSVAAGSHHVPPGNRWSTFGMVRRASLSWGVSCAFYPGCIREDLHVQGSPLSSRPATNLLHGVYINTWNLPPEYSVSLFFTTLFLTNHICLCKDSYPLLSHQVVVVDINNLHTSSIN